MLKVKHLVKHFLKWKYKMHELIKTVISVDVVRVILNRPDKKNALSLEMMKQLLSVLSSVPDSTRIIVVEAEGAFFCSGMDLEDVVQYGQKCTQTIGEVFTALTNLSCITIAKVRGGAFAGGLGLVAACDFAFASKEALFCLPELQKGLVPAFVCSLLKGQVHPRALNELILTGDRFTAEKMERIGVINQAVELDALDLITSETIQKILKSAPQATKLFKKHFMQKDFQVLFNKAYDLHAQVLATGESKEGLQAYLEKRMPKW